MNFRVRSEAAADVIGAKPKAFPRVHREIRRALLERFPYALYYRLPDPDTLEVVACLHTRRNPHILRSRE